MAKVTAAEKKKAQDFVNSTFTADSVKAYTDAYNQAKSTWSSTKDAVSNASGLLVKSSTSSGWTSSGGTSSGWVSGNSTSWWDVYGDKSKNATTTSSMDFSKYTWNKKLADSDAVFGENAKIKEKGESWFLTRRNDSIASELYNLWTVWVEDVEKYLTKYNDFNAASQEDRDNTIRAISTRLSEIQKENGMDTYTDKTTITWANGDKTTETTKTTEENPSKDGYYYDAKTGQYVKIYWYDDLDNEYRGLIDRMDEKERKYLSNMWASGMQDQVKTYLDAMRSKDQAEARQKNAQELYDINRAQSLIEAQQTLRHSQEQYDNLKQNWQYLGNMWMPGTSQTKINAIGDALKEAQTTLGEIQKLTKLKLDAQEKQWEGQVLQYNQQIDNLMYDLNWKVGSEVQAALSKFTTAELEWQLDTIDGITAFRKELLDDLDANISWLTSASLQQMQYITEQYQDIADKLYQYQQNANTVNQEMSQIKGYYIDGNGNPIFNAKGETIEVPQNPPMEPVFDKDTWKLIVFWYDENWQIVASVQQLWDSSDSPASQLQFGIVSALEQWYSIGDILKMFPNADIKTVQELSKMVDQKYGADGRSLLWDGGNYTAVDQNTLKNAYDSFTSKWATINEDGKFVLNWKHQKGWQCWHFVNNYLQELGIARLFTDPITDKMKNINSYEAKRGSVVIMNSHSSPEYWHVGIVTNVDENGNMTILQSNKAWEEEVFFSKKNIDDGDVLGFFDPTKSIDQYNAERKWQAAANKWDTWLGGYRDGYVPDYTNFLKSGVKWFSNGQRDELINIFGSWENFVSNAEAYKTELDHQVWEVAMTMVDNMTDILAWLSKDDNSINDLRFPIPWTKAWTMRNKYNQVMKSSALQKLIDLKADGATFGALSDNELGFITDAADWFSLWWSEDDLTTWMKQKINKILDKSHMTLDQYASRRGVNYGWWTTDNWWNNTVEETGEDLTMYSRNQW